MSVRIKEYLPLLSRLLVLFLFIVVLFYLFSVAKENKLVLQVVKFFTSGESRQRLETGMKTMLISLRARQAKRFLPKDSILVSKLKPNQVYVSDVATIFGSPSKRQYLILSFVVETENALQAHNLSQRIPILQEIAIEKVHDLPEATPEAVKKRLYQALKGPFPYVKDVAIVELRARSDSDVMR